MSKRTQYLTGLLLGALLFNQGLCLAKSVEPVKNVKTEKKVAAQPSEGNWLYRWWYGVDAKKAAAAKQVAAQPVKAAKVDKATERKRSWLSRWWIGHKRAEKEAVSKSGHKKYEKSEKNSKRHKKQERKHQEKNKRA